MTEAFIRGRAAKLDDAIAVGADILAAARSPVVAGLGTDIAGATAAVALARRLGAVVDHMHADAALRDLDVMRTAGWTVTTPLQGRARAGMVLLVGPGIPAAWPDLAARLGLADAPTLFPDQARRVVRLCPGRGETVPKASDIKTISGDPLTVIGVLRALVNGRRIAGDARAFRDIAALAAELVEVPYTLIVWSSAGLESLTIEMIAGLIDDLNGKRRCAGLPLPAPDNAAGVFQCHAWLTGVPTRFMWRGDAVVHDAWRFDTARMIAAGEADAALWLSALSPLPPPWSRAIPTVALMAPGGARPVRADVCIEVGVPAQDHDAVLHDIAAGTLVAWRAAEPSARPAAATVLERMVAALPPC